GTREETILRDVYAFYHGRKARFETLASFVAGRILGESGTRYQHGWVTRGSGDEGVDFVGRIDIGSSFSLVGLVVLGQAKCEKVDEATNGRDIARTVARLRRGWLGVYVTTSYFSVPAQREVIEDRYPIVLVPGLRIATELAAAMHDRKLTDLSDLLEE